MFVPAAPAAASPGGDFAPFPAFWPFFSRYFALPRFLSQPLRRGAKHDPAFPSYMRDVNHAASIRQYRLAAQLMRLAQGWLLVNDDMPQQLSHTFLTVIFFSAPTSPC